MYDFAIIWDWIAFAVRWLHVITAMAWIGASFFFIALDLGLRKAAHMPQRAFMARSGRFMAAAFITSRNIWSLRRTCPSI